jgi:hypothetical protein
VHD